MSSVGRYEGHAALLRSHHRLTDAHQNVCRQSEIDVVDHICELFDVHQSLLRFSPRSTPFFAQDYCFLDGSGWWWRCQSQHGLMMIAVMAVGCLAFRLFSLCMASGRCGNMLVCFQCDAMDRAARNVLQWTLCSYLHAESECDTEASKRCTCNTDARAPSIPSTLLKF